MNELKIGDRVEVIGVGICSNPIKTGMRGTVKLIREWLIGVEFDEYMGGHNGIWDGKDGYCWYLPDKYLKKLQKARAKDE